MRRIRVRTTRPGRPRGHAQQDLRTPLRPAPALLKPAPTALTAEDIMTTTRRVAPFAEFGRQDVGLVGGKNASLGEMTAHLAAAGVRVPPGFATTADAYEELLDGHGLRARIEEQIDRLHDGVALDEVGAAIRSMIRSRCSSGYGPRSSPRTSGSRATRAGKIPRSPCEAVPPPRTCLRRASPASRRPT
ncbi:PEP/pyruvate-binding domain-containing protein [Streptomyces laculatispora]|uniref:PEP/pyruvate-binding domain-containing protein n=1 Tax=Streptomyces laculatispora TaxID=887464 RepID=UPI0027DB4C0C|nr:PEP/pyruvate-binding domain-containing protein [Streptomyces laculatispora]